MNKILVIPLDNRPCNTQFPQKIGAIVDWEILFPDNRFIGDLKIQGQRHELGTWLLSNTDDLKGIVISVDMLGYGGLVFSRKSEEAATKILSHLEVLKQLRAKNSLPVLAFNTIMRISNSNDNTEEKEYWAKYGKLIYKYSVLHHKNIDIVQKQCHSALDAKSKLFFIDSRVRGNDNKNETSQNINALNMLKSKIPPQILENYLKGRQRNFKINKAMINWLNKNFLDFLILNADDTSKYGFNVIEKDKLEKFKEKSLYKDKIMVYCGADEISLLLISRLINQYYNFTPTFYPIYSHINGEKHFTMYEDSDLGETLNNQVKSLGGKLVSNEVDADCLLFIYTPYKNQGDLFLNKNMPVKPAVVPQSFIDKIKLALDNNKTVGIIDAAYANGADNTFMTNLSKEIEFYKLTAFSAWNTTANTIGTVISTCSSYLNSKKTGNPDFQDKHSWQEVATMEHENVIARSVNDEAICRDEISTPLARNDRVHFQGKERLEFLFERLLDDWIYQGDIRLKAKKKKISFNIITKLLKTEGEKLFINHFKDKKINNYKIKSLETLNIFYPWKRFFEVCVDCKFVAISE